MIIPASNINIIRLEDCDKVKILYLSKNPSAYTRLYQNEDTRTLDMIFGMDGSVIQRGDMRLRDLIKCTQPYSLGNKEVESTLEYFVEIAEVVIGNFLGVREDELREHMERLPGLANLLDIEASLYHKDEGRGPYLIRKKIEGYDVLFPRKLPVTIN